MDLLLGGPVRRHTKLPDVTRQSSPDLCLTPALLHTELKRASVHVYKQTHVCTGLFAGTGCELGEWPLPGYHWDLVTPLQIRECV